MTIRRRLPAWARRAQPDGLAATVLGSRGRTAHVLSVATPDGDVVLKRYPPGDGAKVARHMRAIRQALDADGATRLAVPAISRFDAGSGVLAQTAAPGRPLLPLLRSAGRARALTAAAEALVALHHCGARLGRVTTIADHVADLMRPHPRGVARALAVERPRIHAVLEALTARTGPPPMVTPVHRDVHARQMMLDGGRVWLVDWDLAAMGDPALDVANFRVYLRTHLDDGERAAAQFLDRYARHDPAMPARLPVYEALTYLRLVCKAWRLRPAGWRTRLRSHLRAAERRL